jgi:hypothetical protein
VPRHVARLVTRLVTPLVVDYSASRRLDVDYFAHATRLVTRLVAPLIVDYSTSRRLVVDYFAHAARQGASARRAARHAAHHAARRRLLCLAWARRRQLRLAPLVVDYFASAARLGASARRAARHAARRRLLRLAQARRRLLRPHCVSGCLGTSCGSSRGSSRRSSSTTPAHAGSSSINSPTPRVRVPRHVARLTACRRLLRLRRATGCLKHVARLVAPLVVDYFAYATRQGASARCAARHAAHRRLLRAPRLRLAATLTLLQPHRAW